MKDGLYKYKDVQTNDVVIYDGKMWVCEGYYRYFNIVVGYVDCLKLVLENNKEKVELSEMSYDNFIELNNDIWYITK